MTYWWVNQNQTFEQEVRGGYIWSPKLKANGQRNPFYEYMKIVVPGDPLFSFEGTFIRAIGIARSHCYEFPKPDEFGSLGPNWDDIGWRVDVHYHKLGHQIRPADNMGILGPLLPLKYAPLQANGYGNQGVYLTQLPEPFGLALAGLIGPEAQVAIAQHRLADEISDLELSFAPASARRGTSTDAADAMVA